MVASAAYANGPLAKVDINTDIVLDEAVYDFTVVGGSCRSFNPQQPGGWGGKYGDGAVTAFPGDIDPAGYCILTWSEGKAHRLELGVLDGIADDSFEVYVMNPGGNWVYVYSYADQYTAETWITHHIYSFPAGKGQGTTVELKIVPTGPQWSGFNDYGQLAVDYIAVYED